MLTKNTNRFGVGLKVAIVFLAAFYIAWKLLGKDLSNFSFADLKSFIRNENHWQILVFVILLMPVNWLLESWKWKIIASTKIKISFKDSIRGVLAGVTIGTATPNRVGEFAGRIFMVTEGNRVELLLLSFISSFCQVFVTIVAGLFGILFSKGIPHVLNYFTFGILIAGGIIFCSIPFWIKFLPERWREKSEVVMRFPKRKLLDALFISAIRYSVYVFQFWLLIYLIFPGWNLFSALQCITITYFIVTMIPTFSFTEVFVRGSVAAAVFSVPNDVSGTMVGFWVAIILWTINVAIPSLIGTVFVLKLKFFRSVK